jgi:ABC-type Na+ transport system ATPase subunit NatA
LLGVSGLSFHYQPLVPVLADLTFSVLDGEIVGLLGKNGVGKTTALKLILGLLPIEKGSICLGNYSLDLHPMQYKKQINYAGKKRIDLLGTRQFLLGLFSVCLLCLRQTTILYFCLELVFGL